jgi:hypothetical protein
MYLIMCGRDTKHVCSTIMKNHMFSVVCSTYFYMILYLCHHNDMSHYASSVA